MKTTPFEKKSSTTRTLLKNQHVQVIYFCLSVIDSVIFELPRALWSGTLKVFLLYQNGRHKGNELGLEADPSQSALPLHPLKPTGIFFLIESASFVINIKIRMVGIGLSFAQKSC